MDLLPNQWIALIGGIVGMSASVYEIFRRHQRWKADPTLERQRQVDQMIRFSLVFLLLVVAVWWGLPEVQAPEPE